MGNRTSCILHEQQGRRRSPDDYLMQKVFAGQKGTKMDPDPKDVEGYNTFIERFKKTLPIMKAATETMK